MDDRTGKHSAADLRTNVQRTTNNISAGGVEKLIPSCVFLLLLSAIEDWKTDLKSILPSPSSWPDLTTTKRRRDRRKYSMVAASSLP
jgi:hypothetical protein